MKMASRKLQAAALAAAAFASPAAAEDGSSRDRAEFDAAAGRMPLQAAFTAKVDQPQPTRPGEPSARDNRPERRTVRVILPSPYGR
jgi:hypothetical protein